MHEATLRTVGGSVMVAIPKAVLEALGLQANTKVGLTLDDGRLVIEPSPRRRYTLDELLAQCDPDAPMSQEDQDWLRDPPVGREAF